MLFFAVLLKTGYGLGNQVFKKWAQMQKSRKRGGSEKHDKTHFFAVFAVFQFLIFAFFQYDLLIIWGFLKSKVYKMTVFGGQKKSFFAQKQRFFAKIAVFENFGKN